MGNDGRKISKSLGNYTDPLELTDKYSADAYRLVLVDSPVLAGEDFSLTDKDVADKQRKLDTLRNTLEFFLLYAAADDGKLTRLGIPGRQSRLIYSTLAAGQIKRADRQLTAGLEAYDLPSATKPLQIFIDDLSNWYAGVTGNVSGKPTPTPTSRLPTILFISLCTIWRICSRRLPILG